MARFGATAGETVPFVDVTGTELEISDKLFLDKNGRLKMTKRGRERDMNKGRTARPLPPACPM